ncbi:unnamed protein product [Oncorhynchus mykiss]|uniref:Uncharacterized protein n=1 Tax=Oncorhynchus mykiss TaxID=8022 RepID=A0A060XB66_ONCMY|nr:unnamed protein product [Oncorhynchus mykiss]
MSFHFMIVSHLLLILHKKISFISLCLKPEMWQKFANFKGAEYFRKALYISLVTPKTNSSFGRLSFQFSAANDWNELQKSLKLETLISLTSFKHQLSEQLTDYCTCT